VVESKPGARLAFGIPKFDAMLNGGLPAGHIALFSGNTGTGKSAFALHFVATGLQAGEACVYVTLEEPGAQLTHNAEQFGWPFSDAQRQGRLTFLEVPMSDVRTDQLLYQIVNASRQCKATRLVVDSLSGLERAIPQPEELRDFLEQLVRFCKTERITSVMTYAAPAVFGARIGQLMATVSVTEAQLSSIVDAIFLLRFVEREQGVINLLNVLKMRASAHDRGIYEYSICEQGVVIGDLISAIAAPGSVQEQSGITHQVS
jgi:circadian clock protein KaiC